MRDRTKDLIASAVDRAAVPVTALAARHLRVVRGHWSRFPRQRAVLARAGLLPVIDHYYEPYPPSSLDRGRRRLSGVALDLDEQLRFLEKLRRYLEEASALGEGPIDFASPTRSFSFGNTTFGHGDAEVLFAIARHARPRLVVEVGAGASTLLLREALGRNALEGAPARHVCIEPFEHGWLDGEPVELDRRRLEELPDDVFAQLGEGDILFIDSSHVVRPGSDVLHELLVLLPLLRPGVYVHVHDVFTPYNYPDAWVLEDRRLWHEQYVLEAFLTCNPRFEVLCGMHQLAREAPDRLADLLPGFRPGRHVPGSFWMRASA